MDQTQMLARLTTLDTAVADMGAAVVKIGNETTNLLLEIQALRDAVAAAGNTTPAVDAALAAVEARVGTIATALTAVDALVPDVLPPAP